MTQKKLPPLKFPCEYEFRIMGKNDDAFKQTVLELLRPFFPTLSHEALKSKPSKAGKYQSITAVFMADSQTQIESAYQALKQHPDVLMIL